MTQTQIYITIAAIALGTALTRFAPFVLLSKTKPVPRVLRYLGTVLPCAAIGLLLVYCLKDIPFAAAPHGAPEILALAVTIGLHV